ncbi:MAG: class I SAM-dependent methyltransferase [Epsilonproteobacteria bacterium]|nr:class I SAM-dependent methyltransferase [Campylobacterota bacterium]
MGAKLILDYHTGIDHYSDGDIEDELLEIVKTHKSYEKILQKDDRWPILYHLSPIRENIINWYPFKASSNCLEIGGGCGAITGALCRSLDKVTTVELSKRRASILYERHKYNDNLTIYVGNLNDIPLQKNSYNYIILNGVLEYAGMFTKTQNPYEDFLKNIKQYLKADGELLIAIENRYGMKYFAGAREDHTAQFFDGIEGYQKDHGIRTFGKKELEGLIEKSGLHVKEFYYPHPDYKMPLEIFSDERLPQSKTQLLNAYNFDYDRYTLFDEAKAFEGIIENAQFPFFANSFFVVCGV